MFGAKLADGCERRRRNKGRRGKQRWLIREKGSEQEETNKHAIKDGRGGKRRGGAWRVEGTDDGGALTGHFLV